MLEPYVMTFTAIFVAVDAIGNIPIFSALVEHLNGEKRRKVIRDAVVTATVMAVIFMIGGKFMLRLLGITISDFQVAGGAFLFIMASRLLFPGEQRKHVSSDKDREIGIFPIGTPLVTGPAVLTTTLMMVDSYHIGPTFVALVLNMLIVYIAFSKAEGIMKIFGQSGALAFAKVMYILLGSIGVMMIRHGLKGFLL